MRTRQKEKMVHSEGEEEGEGEERRREGGREGGRESGDLQRCLCGFIHALLLRLLFPHHHPPPPPPHLFFFLLLALTGVARHGCYKSVIGLLARQRAMEPLGRCRAHDRCSGLGRKKQSR